MNEKEKEISVAAGVITHDGKEIEVKSHDKVKAGKYIPEKQKPENSLEDGSIV